jgi:hypothetical protein
MSLSILYDGSAVRCGAVRCGAVLNKDKPIIIFYIVVL